MIRRDDNKRKAKKVTLSQDIKEILEDAKDGVLKDKTIEKVKKINNGTKTTKQASSESKAD